ncbi:hypothetical protein EJO69_10085 [Flaviflexus salsibiostraticola]|uniref:Apea-like HEPN domain-containing protein n=1 Tax=Flaviflexus salsibiostraticola TaxID=1282737 RepID=A0A3S8ZAV3_9ACTO|nr:hypothetical protein [Flaviflexus salsibiostraticola]AZN30609.1 hypothetical protein EJO69_10085 [Flaviflexus salsibiostraticola]
MLDEVLARLGPGATGYLLNCSASELEHGKSPTLTPQQRGALEFMNALEDEFAPSPFGEGAVDSRWTATLASPGCHGINSLANEVRLHCGGELPKAPTTFSELERTLAQLALRVYPALLVKGKGTERKSRPSFSVYNHDLNGIFQSMILNDTMLSEAFLHSRNDGSDQKCMVTPSMGGRRQLMSFADTLIWAGWKLAKAHNKAPSAEQLAEAAVSSLRVLRKAISGEGVQVPVRIGLAGALLPAGTANLDFPWGKLRRVDETDQIFIGATPLKGSLARGSEDGEGLAIAYSGDLVLETTCSYTVNVVDSEQMQGIEFNRDPQQEIQRKFESIALGILLTSPEARPVVVRAWQSVFDPLDDGISVSWSEVDRNWQISPRRLTEEEAFSWQLWSARVQEFRIPEIGIAIRRALAATAHREAPEDALIDAVIGWENLVGTRANIVSSVTGALARLLSEQGDVEMAKRKLGNVYDARSRLVHGDPKTEEDGVRKSSIDAVMTLLRALRKFFDTDRHLLDYSKSSDRARILLNE